MLNITSHEGVHSLEGQPQMQAEVILASYHPGIAAASLEAPLYTIRLRYPRIIHGEVMTHRVFGRNARSSRAVPVKTMLNEVRTIPFVPWHWGKNQKGMQASEECNELIRGVCGELDMVENTVDGVSRESAWLQARDHAADIAEAFMDAGYHKQLPNRLLEPFSWIDTLITSNRWKNFLWLRDHGDAEPHIRDLARLVQAAIDEASVQNLEDGQWHLPYITDEDRQNLCDYQPPSPVDVKNLLKVSAARCARISYKPFDGNAAYERELDRYNMLVSADRVHASPLEHQAKGDELAVVGNHIRWSRSDLHGNLPGWVQARKLVPNEAVHE